MKYLQQLANTVTVVALAFIAFSSFGTAPAATANAERPAMYHQNGGMMGTLILSALDFEPRGWAWAEGQTADKVDEEGDVPIHEFIGTRFGGTATTFKLPDLKGKEPVPGTRWIICTYSYYTEKWGSYRLDGL